jgi:hypothetical protein
MASAGEQDTGRRPAEIGAGTNTLVKHHGAAVTTTVTIAMEISGASAWSSCSASMIELAETSRPSPRTMIGTDITEHRTAERKLYPCAIKDVISTGSSATPSVTG